MSGKTFQDTGKGHLITRQINSVKPVEMKVVGRQDKLIHNHASTSQGCPVTAHFQRMIPIPLYSIKHESACSRTECIENKCLFSNLFSPAVTKHDLYIKSLVSSPHLGSTHIYDNFVLKRITRIICTSVSHDLCT